MYCRSETSNFYIRKKSRIFIASMSRFTFQCIVGCIFHRAVEGYRGSTAYAGNVKKAARRETCAETFYDAF
jgi:hypothetical protein